MSKKKVEIICIMDRSDSMNEIIQEAVGGVQRFHQRPEGPAG